MSHLRRAMRYRNFYPGDLSRQIAEFLGREESTPLSAQRLVAAAVPHAGWRYSGGIAARTLRTLASRSRPQSIVLFGAVHRAWIDSSAIYPSGEWETPLGPVAVDEDLAAEMIAKLGNLVEVNPMAHDSEHSLEVELPFLHELFPGVPVLPMMIPPKASPAELGKRLARAIGVRDIVAVASTDLTHYGDDYSFVPAGYGGQAHAWMRRNDQRMLDLARALKAEEIPREAMLHRNACGPGALAAAVAFSRELGAREGTVLEHTDSHEVSAGKEPFQMAVGYAGIVF